MTLRTSRFEGRELGRAKKLPKVFLSRISD